MQLFLRLCKAGHALIAILFAVTAALLLVTAAHTGWFAMAHRLDAAAATG